MGIYGVTINGYKWYHGVWFPELKELVAGYLFMFFIDLVLAFDTSTEHHP